MNIPATTSAAEFEQQRQVRRVLRCLMGRPDVGECDWTDRVDNAGLGARNLSVVPLVVRLRADSVRWEEEEDWE